MPTGAAVLWTTLGRLRRRQRRVTLAENGLAAAIVIAAAAVPLSFSLAPGIATRVIVLLACIAAAGVVVVAIVRTPTPRRIAALADARLHLEDRLVTALQYVDDPDAVSRLVVRDAASRIADASPASVFPFRAAAWIAWIAAAALTASAVLTLIATKTSSGGVLQTDAQSGAGVSGAAANTDGSIRSGEAASSGPTSREHALQQSGPAPARALDSATGADRTGDRGPATGPRAAQSAAPAPPSEAARLPDAVAAPAAPPAAAAGVAPRAAGAASSRDIGSAGGTTSRGRSTVSGAGGISPRGPGAGSGGTARTGGAARLGTRQGIDDARDSAARARAEAALASERIPPGLRAYLMAYFTAIRPR